MKPVSANSTLFLMMSPSASLEGFFERLSLIGWNLSIDPSDAKTSNIAVLPISKKIDLADCGERVKEVKAINPRIMVVAVFSGKSKYKAFQFKEIGCDFIFQIPIEEELFLNRVCEWVPLDYAEEGLNFEHLMRVNLLSIKDQKTAPFDLYLYLPANKKVVRYIKENDTVDAKVLEKFDKSKNFSLFIKRSQIRKYKEFTLSVLSSHKDESGQLQVATKVENLKSDFQHLMSPFFSEAELTDEEAQQTVGQVNEILKDLEVATTISKDAVGSLETLAYQKMTNANHGQNVATYCALFGLALGRKDLEDLRLGGLLHDIGLSDMPMEILFKGEAGLTGEDKSRYRLHPGNGQLEVKNRKIPANETVMNMILFHHERPNGLGYPYGKKGAEIPVEAYICALADEFDKLTSLRDGHRCYSSIEAMELISGKLTGVPHELYYAPVHQPIIEFFLKKHQEMQSATPSSKAAAPSKVATKVAVEFNDAYVGSHWSNPITLSSLAALIDNKTEKLEFDSSTEEELNIYAQELEFYFLSGPKKLL